MRLDKFLCECLNISRSESKEVVKKGKVLVNNQVTKDSSININESEDTVTVNGECLKYEKFVYYMLNKPAGVVSATNDNLDKTVIDLLKAENRNDLFPIGRLDKDTVGLLIITNDGQLSHHLTSPNHHVAKTYYVETLNPVSDSDIASLEKGVLLTGDGITKPASVGRIDLNKINLTISEGKFHQVKRMLIAVSNEVTYLKRISIGHLKLDECLKEGDYRRLTEEEIKLLKG